MSIELHKKSYEVLALFVVAFIQSAAAQDRPAPRFAAATDFPSRWDVKVREGTKLAEIKATYETRARVMMTDLEDKAPLPHWFRGYLRDNLSELPASGPYQYPRVAVEIFEWMLAHPNLEPPRSAMRSPARVSATRRVRVGGNINITSLDERNSESAIAVDYSNPKYLIAAANNISGSGRQRQFYSSDGGSSWSKTELPLASGTAFQSDPSVAFTTDGTTWAATLGINSSGSSIKAQLYKSTDHGATWSFVSTVSSGNNNDKEMMWIDTHSASPYKDYIYLAWDVPGSGMRFVRSTDKGVTWPAVQSLSTDSAIGAHLSTGPSGELYVAWPDTTSRQLRVRKSTDGGATFAAAKVIATTNARYEVSIPAMCNRQMLVYLTIGVDRSGGPRKSNVYATWNDRNGSAADPGCGGTSSASNTNIYFSASTDGGTTWSAPKVIHTDPASTDQFNQWMDVDPDDGNIHVMFYDTRDDAARVKTNVYYIASRDGGATWVDETKVTDAQTDETASGADSGNQYGDYNGMTAYRGNSYPSWTDRRSGTPSGKEQIYTAALSERLVFPGLCAKNPKLCVKPGNMIPGGFTLVCKNRPCMVIDPLPRNCQIKFSCPGCPPGGLCPPYYNIYLAGLGSAWTVDLLGPKGESAPHSLTKSGNVLVLSFQPSKDNFQGGKVGNYALAFRLQPKGKVGAPYQIKTSLKASDKPLSPKQFGPPEKKD